MTPSSKADATRAAIIQSAAELFAAHGYHGTSYRALIEHSGFSKGSFYFHFPSKLDLALETYRVKQHELLDTALRASRGDGGPLERLLSVLEARVRAYRKDRSLRVLPRLSTDFARDPELAPVVRELHANAMRAIEQLVRDAKAAGEVRGEVDPKAVARVVFATIVGMDEVSERETHGADLEDRSREFLELLRWALVPTGGSAPS